MGVSKKDKKFPCEGDDHFGSDDTIDFFFLKKEFLHLEMFSKCHDLHWPFNFIWKISTDASLCVSPTSPLQY